MNSKISKAIALSLKEWEDIYDYVCYVFSAINALFIFSWIFVKMPLYYILDKYKYMEEKKITENKLTFWNKALNKYP